MDDEVKDEKNTETPKQEETKSAEETKGSPAEKPAASKGAGGDENKDVKEAIDASVDAGKKIADAVKQAAPKWGGVISRLTKKVVSKAKKTFNEAMAKRKASQAAAEEKKPEPTESPAAEKAPPTATPPVAEPESKSEAPAPASEGPKSDDPPSGVPKP